MTVSGSRLPRAYVGIWSIAPGRYSATSATRSSNSVGRTFLSASRMPSDSNWNTPIESPRASIAYVLASSSGSVAMSGRSPLERSTMSSASSITSRLRSPRKSIFSRPISSIGFIENCVTVR